MDMEDILKFLGADQEAMEYSRQRLAAREGPINSPEEIPGPSGSPSAPGDQPEGMDVDEPMPVPPDGMFVIEGDDQHWDDLAELLGLPNEPNVVGPAEEENDLEGDNFGGYDGLGLLQAVFEAVMVLVEQEGPENLQDFIELLAGDEAIDWEELAGVLDEVPNNANNGNDGRRSARG